MDGANVYLAEVHGPLSLQYRLDEIPVTHRDAAWRPSKHVQ